VLDGAELRRLPDGQGLRQDEMTRARRITQLAFLALVLAGVYLVRGHAELWCPLGGVEGLYGFVRSGSMPCSLGVANLYILGGVLLGVFLLRRAFCSHACPIGTISEWMGRLGRRPRRVPPRLDRALGLLRYAALAAILFFTWRTGELVFRGYDPCYALISRHGEDITRWAYVSAGAILAGSVFVSLPFCRWFCPLAAVFHPFSYAGRVRIRRDPAACSGCGACTGACPMEIPVAARESVTDARCTACLECVAACPERERGALALALPGARRRLVPQAALIAALVACLAAAAVPGQLFAPASFTRTRGAVPARVATVELRVRELNCRGRATLLAGFLEREDLYALPGHLKLEVWPAPGAGRAKVTYDPAATDPASIRRAIVEPWFDPTAGQWLASPFAIEGYDPLAPATPPPCADR
jgi:ferredoxin